MPLRVIFPKGCLFEKRELRLAEQFLALINGKILAGIELLEGMNCPLLSVGLDKSDAHHTACLCSGGIGDFPSFRFA